VAAAYAWSYWPPAAATKSAAERAIVGYELAPAPIWPVKYYGLKRMTPQIAADIHAGYARNLRLYATGHVLAFLLHQNIPGNLTDSRRRGHGRFDVLGTGRVVYYEFRGRRPNGDLVIRAAVEHTFTTAQWDARTRSLTTDPADTIPEAIIYDYTLHSDGGTWKVSTAIGWKFLDVPSGRITYDPPSSVLQGQP
jgi:hypothetical protein